MQIKTIHLENYRGIENLTVDFSSGVNLIIGNNGAGKSSLLDGIGVMLEHLFELILFGVQPKLTIEKDDVRMFSSTLGDNTGNTIYYTPSKIVISIELNGTKYDYIYIKNHEESFANFNMPNVAIKMKELAEDNKSMLPLISYQTDKRSGITTKAMTDAQFALKKPERKQGYSNSLKSNLTFDVLEKWALFMEFDKAQSEHEAREYFLFKKIVSSFIGKMEMTQHEASIRFSLKHMQLTYSCDGKEEPIRYLSAGYQSVLCLIMELAYRTALLNPYLDNVDNLEGVVMIDEIDMHLHPRWQWRILSALRATFPKVQFIIATHSPIVISSAENAKLMLMENSNKVKELADAYGNNVGEVLELTQGSLEMPEEVKKWRYEIEQALDENDLRKAERIIQATANKLGETSSTVQSMRDFLEVNKWIVDEE